MEKENVLNIENLSFGYSSKNLIYKDFSLKVQRGELVCIVGKSGSGKSTLFELIASNLHPLRGSIEVKKIATIYQDPYSSFHPTYPIIEQINDVVDSYLSEELQEILSALNLSCDLIEKKPHYLSGGQLQRCSILRAILMKPDIILADEPTSALDNIIALDTMKILITLLDKVGILFITHDRHLAKWCSDKIIDIEKL